MLGLKMGVLLYRVTALGCCVLVPNAVHARGPLRALRPFVQEFFVSVSQGAQSRVTGRVRFRMDVNQRIVFIGKNRRDVWFLKRINPNA
jgi:hypothetical protein